MSTEHEQELKELREQIYDLEEAANEPCLDCETYADEATELQKEIDDKDTEIKRLKDIIQDAYNAM